MYSLKSTTFLVLFLIVPLFLRKFNLEPYPAVLLPGGAVTITEEKGYTKFNYQEIFGMTKERKWQKIDVAVLLYPIPAQYFQAIFSKRYDTTYFQNKQYKILKRLHLVKTTPQSREVDLWFSNKLLQLNLLPDTLHLVTFIKKINIKTRKITTLTADEKNIHLYR